MSDIEIPRIGKLDGCKRTDWHCMGCQERIPAWMLMVSPFPFMVGLMIGVWFAGRVG